MSSTLSPVLSPGLAEAAQSDSGLNSKNPAKIREAAGQFESLLIGQMLKSMHEDEEGWLGTGDDPSASSAMGLADEYLAQSISQRGGLGLAQMITRQLDSSNSNPEQPQSQDSVDILHTDH